MHEPTEPTEPTEGHDPREPHEPTQAPRRLKDSPFLPALLLQVCAFTALAFGWKLTAGVCWILFFGYALFLLTKQVEEAATSRKRLHADEMRGHRVGDPPPKKRQVPPRKPWRARRRSFFRDWPGGPDV